MSAQQYFNGPPQGQGGYGYSAPQGPPPPNNYQAQFNQYPNAAQNPNQQQYYPPPNNAPPPPQQQGGGWGMKQSEPYAAPAAPPPQQYNNNGGNAEYGNNGNGTGFSDTAPYSPATEVTGPRFLPKKRLNDVIPLVLFIAAVIGFAVVSGISINTFIKYNGLSGGFGGRNQGGTGAAVTLN